MAKIYCAAVDCKYNGNKNVCTRKTISLRDSYIMTVYDGRQHFNTCKDYQESEQYKRMKDALMRCLYKDKKADED